MTHFRLIDRDLGYEDFVRLLRFLGKIKAQVSVGITQESGAAEREGTTVAEIATIHEFGLGQIERSWLRGWFDENREFIKTQIRKAANAVVEGRLDIDQALELLGQQFVGSIKERITSGSALAPNAESTIKRKGSSTPLVDEGRLLSAITYEVEVR